MNVNSERPLFYRRKALQVLCARPERLESAKVDTDNKWSKRDIQEFKFIL